MLCATCTCVSMSWGGVQSPCTILTCVGITPWLADLVQLNHLKPFPGLPLLSKDLPPAMRTFCQTSSTTFLLKDGGKYAKTVWSFDFRDEQGHQKSAQMRRFLHTSLDVHVKANLIHTFVEGVWLCLCLCPDTVFMCAEHICATFYAHLVMDNVYIPLTVGLEWW